MLRRAPEVTQIVDALTQDPFGELVDQVALFDQGQEAIRVQETELGMAPAHERFDGFDAPADERRLGLVVEDQLVGLDERAGIH